MPKTIVVVQRAHKCEVMVNPPESAYINEKHLVNPDMSKVLGTPPHEWSIRFGSLVPASSRIVEQREAVLHPDRIDEQPRKKSLRPYIIGGIIIAIAVIVLVVRYHG